MFAELVAVSYIISYQTVGNTKTELVLLVRPAQNLLGLTGLVVERSSPTAQPRFSSSGIANRAYERLFVISRFC